jgi:hypothetical protein
MESKSSSSVSTSSTTATVLAQYTSYQDIVKGWFKEFKTSLGNSIATQTSPTKFNYSVELTGKLKISINIL